MLSVAGLSKVPLSAKEGIAVARGDVVFKKQYDLQHH
jgi:hypothetical protein